MSLIAGKSALPGTLLLVTSGNGTKLLVPLSTSIEKSFDLSTSSGSIATDATGIKATLGPWRITLPKLDVATDVWIRLKWEIVVASVGTPSGRLNVNLQKEGGAISGLTKASGPARDLAAVAGTTYEEWLHVRIPATSFAAGDRLDVLIEVEVTVASGSGGSTATVKIHHDPATAGNESFVELNL